MWECVNCQEVLEEEFAICWSCGTTREGRQPINFLESVQTQYNFSLPKGYIDSAGNIHREGIMRLAVAADEVVPLGDPRVQANPAYFCIILLSRVIQKLGNIEVTPEVIEGLFAADLAYLQEFYNRINGTEPSAKLLVCPRCNYQFKIEPTPTPNSTDDSEAPTTRFTRRIRIKT